jgi:Flp pilus assembly protein TadD
VLLLCAAWRRNRVSREDVLRTIPFFVAALAFGLMTLSVHHRVDASKAVELAKDSFWVRSIGATWAVWFYLWKELLPFDLTMHYPRWEIGLASWISYLPGALLSGGLCLVWWYRRSWGRSWLFAVTYFLLALAPTLGVVNMSFLTLSRVADHFQYLALPGTLALVIGGLWQWGRTAFPARGVAAAIAFVLVLLTWRYEKIVGNPEALWTDNLTKNPQSWVAHNNLGPILLAQGKFAEAERHCAAALRLVTSLATGDVHYHLGSAFFYQDKFPEAARELQEAVRLMPRDTKAHNNLANALFKTGRTNEALAHFRESIHLDPGNLNARGSYASVLNDLHHTAEAKEQYQEILRLNPGDAGAQNDLGQVLAAEGKLAEALPYFLKAAELNPRSAGIRANLGRALFQVGRLEDALRQFDEAVRLEPVRADWHMLLADALAQLKRTDQARNHYAAAQSLMASQTPPSRSGEAIEHWREALKFSPDSVEILNNLAWALATDGSPQLRNGAEAVELAEKACNLSGGKSAACFDTLAAAYAENGRFDEAVKASGKAVELAAASGQKNLVVRYEKRLSLYRAGIPFHEGQP